MVKICRLGSLLLSIGVSVGSLDEKRQKTDRFCPHHGTAESSHEGGGGASAGRFCGEFLLPEGRGDLYIAAPRATRFQ